MRNACIEHENYLYWAYRDIMIEIRDRSAPFWRKVREQSHCNNKRVSSFFFKQCTFVHENLMDLHDVTRRRYRYGNYYLHESTQALYEYILKQIPGTVPYLRRVETGSIISKRQLVITMSSGMEKQSVLTRNHLRIVYADSFSSSQPRDLSNNICSTVMKLFFLWIRECPEEVS